MIKFTGSPTAEANTAPAGAYMKPTATAAIPPQKASVTAHNITRFVRGAISETEPKWRAVSGTVRMRAPIVVEKLPEMIRRGFLKKGRRSNSLARRSASRVVKILSENNRIPRVAANDSCRPADGGVWIKQRMRHQRRRKRCDGIVFAFENRRD